MSHILIVEDEKDARDALASFLQRAGHNVECVSNGREALASLLKQLPDLVVLDLRMAEMNGLSFLQTIRSYLRLQSVPIVVWTASENGESHEQIQKFNVHS